MVNPIASLRGQAVTGRYRAITGPFGIELRQVEVVARDGGTRWVRATDELWNRAKKNAPRRELRRSDLPEGLQIPDLPALEPLCANPVTGNRRRRGWLFGLVIREVEEIFPDGSVRWVRANDEKWDRAGELEG